jgi:hypothetical protein
MGSDINMIFAPVDCARHVTPATITVVARIELSASSRGITDHFFCFTCDEYVWDCEPFRVTAPTA